jgi:hypothetical protein
MWMQFHAFTHVENSSGQLLKLILNHQESRWTENHNAPLLVKQVYIRRTKQQTCLQCTCYGAQYFEYFLSKILKIVNCAVLKDFLFKRNGCSPYTSSKWLRYVRLFFQYSILRKTIFKFNWLVIRHEMGCRDRPGWINIIGGIDSFIELRCCLFVCYNASRRDAMYLRIILAQYYKFQ